MIPFVRTIPAIKALNTFGITLLQKQLELSDDVANKNILISPLSIFLALSMVYNGSANETKNAIAATLQLDDITTTQLNETCKQLIEQLSADDTDVTVSVANAIWYNKALCPLTSFLNINKNYFHTGIQHITTAEAVNTWVADKTNGKMTNVVNNIDEDTLMLLINTIYFNAGWKQAFKEYNTYSSSFYLQNNNAVEVKFMSQAITTNYHIDTNYRIVELPYGNKSSFSMYIIDGNNNAGIVKLTNELTIGALKKMVAHMRVTEIDLNLPKWESSYSINGVKQLLTQLGMGIAFTNAADFSNMYTEPAFIGDAVHKTYINVTEKGTVAAAVTAMFLAAGAAPPAPKPIITFNRPFLYIIASKKTGAMLFTGILNNPLLKG